MATIHNVSDLIIAKLGAESNSDLNNLKLQKLLYYSQAWHLAFFSKRLFEGRFQAWVHGPVNRDVYDVYKDKKALYSLMRIADIQDPSFASKLSDSEVMHIDSVLEVYAKFTPSQLEFMTHREDPWLKARQDVPEHQRSENLIDESLMESYYKQRLS